MVLAQQPQREDTSDDLEPEERSKVKRKKRLMRFVEYSKRAMACEFQLAIPLLMQHSKSKSKASFTGSAWAKVGIALLLAAVYVDMMGSLFLVLVTMNRKVISESSCKRHGVRIYASGVFLMCMPYCLLMSLNVWYGFLLMALLPLLSIVCLLFAKEHRCRGTGSGSGSYVLDELLYEEHDSKLKHQFDASAAVNTITTGAGLIAAFFGYSTDYSPDHDVTVSESLLFLTILGGQFIMLVTAARPVFTRESSPARFAGFLGLLLGSLPVLLSLSAFAGAVDFVGGLALLAFSIDFLELVFFFKVTFYDEPSSSDPMLPISSATAPAAGEMEGLQLLWLGIMYICFTALVALFEEQAPRKTDLEWLDMGRILVYFWAFCCCSLDGGKSKLPLLLPPPQPPADEHQQHWWWGLARCVIIGLATLDVLCRVIGIFLHSL